MNCKNTKLGFLVAAALMSMNHAAKAQFSAKTPKSLSHSNNFRPKNEQNMSALLMNLNH